MHYRNIKKTAKVLGKHVIQLDDTLEEVKIALKQAVDAKQVILIKDEVVLKNIIHINNYLQLYLSSESPRNKCWKPTYYNDDDSNVFYDKRDKVEFQGTARSIRTDWMLQQKFAHVDCKNDEFNGFLRMMIGGCYELNNNKLIGVRDVIITRGTQFIHYFEIYELNILNCCFCFCFCF